METKEKEMKGTASTEEAKPFPEWKDMTRKEKWDEISFWFGGYLFFDILLAGYHKDLPTVTIPFEILYGLYRAAQILYEKYLA